MQIKAIRLGIFTIAAALAFGATAVDAQDTKDALPEVELDTTEGKILIELDSERAPNTVANFLEYVKSGFYDGTVFHRVIPNFMVQGGGMDEKLSEKPTRAPIRNEASNGVKNKKYTLAMARIADPHSATSQFFINVVDNAYLDRNPARGDEGYAVFGRVVKGLDVVDKISKAKTHVQPSPDVKEMLMRDVPVKPIVIKSARVVNAKD